MAMDTRETITAIATPPGHGGVGIVRVSGTGAPEIARAVLGSLPVPRRAERHAFLGTDAEIIDNGLALYFPAPHSFTGEHVLELHGHGGPVVLDLLLQRITALGARLARPGEFSERAFLNGKMDLAQAEAVADLIASGSQQAARAAVRSLEGAFSSQVRNLAESLVELRMFLESAIDFADEELDLLADADIDQRLDRLTDSLSDLLDEAQQGCLLQEGMAVVIAGRPNAGKSSLLNRLARRDSAIVTRIPGTTRDVLREQIQLDGMPLHVIDTAGLREGGDLVEQEGIRRAWRAIEDADRLLLVVDDTVGRGGEETAVRRRLPEALPVTVVHNKIDLTGSPPGVRGSPPDPTVYISAETGAGIAALEDHLKACMGYHGAEEGRFTARRRHVDALRRARELLMEAKRQWQARRAVELLAEDLRTAHRALGEITGECTTEDLLDRIFSSFCIGK